MYYELLSPKTTRECKQSAILNRQRLKFTAYSLGGPCAPSFCARAPKCQKLRFRSQIDGFLWTDSYAQSVYNRSIAHVQNVQYTVGSWGPRTGGHGIARVDSDHAECGQYLVRIYENFFDI